MSQLGKAWIDYLVIDCHSIIHGKKHGNAVMIVMFLFFSPEMSPCSINTCFSILYTYTYGRTSVFCEFGLN